MMVEQVYTEELPAFLKPVTEEDHKRGINLNWCVGCTGEDCPGCGNGLILNCAELAELSMAHAQQYIEELTKQRDDLLKVLKENVITFNQTNALMLSEVGMGVIDMNVIAKCEKLISDLESPQDVTPSALNV
jgi:hypothetical protein